MDAIECQILQTKLPEQGHSPGGTLGADSLHGSQQLLP